MSAIGAEKLAGTQSKQRFYFLDGLRGMAAIIVFFTHLGGLPALIFSSGGLAVDFFFVLSGFVLAQAYGEGRHSFTTFLRIRLIRLYPLYLLGTLLGVVAAAGRGPDPAVYWALVPSLFFLPPPFSAPPIIAEHGALFPFDGPAWSLFFELAVNFAWFALLPLLNGRRLLALCIGSALVFLLLAILTGSLAHGTRWETFWGGFGRAPYSFFIGTAIFQLWRAQTITIKLPFWLIAAITLVIFALPYNVYVHFFAAIIAFPLIVYLSANINIPKFLNQICTILGNASYAIYILHVPILMFILDNIGVRLVRDEEMGIFFKYHPSYIVFPIAFVCVLIASLVMDRYYDAPVRKWLGKRLLAKRL